MTLRSMMPLLAALVACSAHAQEPADTGASAQSDLTALRETVAEQNALIRRLLSRITRMEARVDALESELDAGAAEPLAGVDANAQAGGDSAAALPELSETERREQERLVRAAFQRTLIDRGGLLLRPGTLDVEPSMSYVHSSADNIVIDGFTILPVLVVGDIVSERVKRDLTQVATTLRFGLPWESQLELRVPFGYEQRRSFTADDMEVSTSGSGLGDIDLGFSRQLTRGDGRWPDLLASLRFKSTTGTSPFDVPSSTSTEATTSLATGTGYESLNLALTGVKVVDPVVYFGSLSYSRNYAHDETIGRVDVGDSAGLSLGMAIALNLNSSLSFAYDHRRIQRTRVDGLGVPGTYATTGMFSVGASFAISDMLTTDLSLGVGLTEDSPDVQIRASFPMRLRR